MMAIYLGNMIELLLVQALAASRSPTIKLH